jgi:vesicular inhibitory amino acid transporter
MIGQTVSDEITRDLMQPKYAYPRWLNLFALWMIVINPVTKFGLCSRPLNLTLETVLGIAEGVFRRPALAVIQEDSAVLDSPAISPGEAPKPQSGSGDLVDPESEAEAKYHSAERKKFVARVISRTIVTGLCTVAAIYLPGFGRVMAFLGSFSAFLICIILPVSPAVTSPSRIED